MQKAAGLVAVVLLHRKMAVAVAKIPKQRRSVAFAEEPSSPPPRLSESELLHRMTQNHEIMVRGRALGEFRNHCPLCRGVSEEAGGSPWVGESRHRLSARSHGGGSGGRTLSVANELQSIPSDSPGWRPYKGDVSVIYKYPREGGLLVHLRCLLT